MARSLLRLVHLEGTKNGKTDEVDFTPLPNHRLTMGRDPSCILAFDAYKDPRVSAHHADIVCDGGSYFLEDRGSTNGTRINGLKIFERTRLRHGDEVELGRKGSRFRIELEDNGAAEKPAEKPAAGAAAGAAANEAPAGEKHADKSPEKLAEKAERQEKAEKAEKTAEPAKKAEPEPRSKPDRPEKDPVREARAMMGAPAQPAAGANLPEALDFGDGVKVGQKTLNLIVQQAHQVAKQQGGGIQTLLREVAKQSATESTNVLKVWLTLLTVVFVLVCAVLITLLIIVTNALSEEKNSRKENEAKVAEALRGHDNDLSKLQKLMNESLVLDLNNIKAAQEAQRLHDKKVQDEYREMELNLERYRRDNRSISERFQSVHDRYKNSIYIIVTRVTLVNDETHAQLGCVTSGTGFVVTAEGHLITNKHVVEPWKYSDLAARMGAEKLTIKANSYEIFAWPTGSHVLNFGSQLNTDTAFSTVKGTLKKYAFLPDRRVTMNIEPYGSQLVNAPDDNTDIMVLKLEGGPFQAVPVYQVPERNEPNPWTPSTLDDVMAVGFPQGISLLDTTVAETSPSLGQIRKVGDTVLISAPIIKGNSGGPVFAFNRKTGNPVVIGIATRVVKDTETLGFCIKIEHALSLLK